MHRPDDTISAALWDHSRSSLIVAGNRLGVWKNKGAIQSSKHSHEAPVTGALYNSHFHQVWLCVVEECSARAFRNRCGTESRSGGVLGRSRSEKSKHKDRKRFYFGSTFVSPPRLSPCRQPCAHEFRDVVVVEGSRCRSFPWHPREGLSRMNRTPRGLRLLLRAQRACSKAMSPPRHLRGGVCGACGRMRFVMTTPIASLSFATIADFGVT